MQLPSTSTIYRSVTLHLPQRGSKIYDLLAAAPLIAWYIVSSASLLQFLRDKLERFWTRPDAGLSLIILSKVAVLGFALVAIGMLCMRSPPSAAAKGIGPRVAAVLGTYLCVGIVLLPPANVSDVALALSSVLILGGMGFSLYAISFLGRSFSLVAEARKLVTTGPYARVRHPLYVGEELAIIGAVIQYVSPAAFALLALQVGCQLYRMRYEEAVLDQSFSDYGPYKVRTARLIPGLY
jgi:protein-S-isoprenylcysteine O-methyltransferase Ste14